MLVSVFFFSVVFYLFCQYLININVRFDKCYRLIFQQEADGVESVSLCFSDSRLVMHVLGADMSPLSA